ncbi:TIGR01459 family HAD-type hydrolase [Hyphococcus sp.]|uniref:TIGR01459 family HAD-type hydrolase n=1 Tax=Hyphococcus sp. TaxID=2038636 RepID=UPI003CCC08A6
MAGSFFISSIRSLAQHYDAMLCDAWGVIHNGVDLFPGVTDALRTFRKERGPVVILTNAPRPRRVIPPQLDRLGLPRDAYDGVVTSGDATRAAIRAHLPSPAFRLGPSKDEALFDGLDIQFAELEASGFMICTGLEDDQQESPDDYRSLLQRAAALKLPMVCANPDIVVNWGGRMIWCAGALAEIYEGLGGKVIYGGKPHAPIYDVACEMIDNIRPGISKSRILAVGDGLKTDIQGANNQGIDALYIAGAGGVHDGVADEAGVKAKLRAAGARVVAASEALLW